MLQWLLPARYRAAVLTSLRLLPSAYCLLLTAYFSCYGFVMPWLPIGVTALPYFSFKSFAEPSL